MTPDLAQPSVYQDLLFQRLRTLHGDHLDDRINWVTTASGPIQRPTYAPLFYRTWSAAFPVDAHVETKSMASRWGEGLDRRGGLQRSLLPRERLRDYLALPIRN